ncbi:hypothetical protein ACHWQZ_G005216 [Mnemiopsis leidyi]
MLRYVKFRGSSVLKQISRLDLSETSSGVGWEWASKRSEDMKHIVLWTYTLSERSFKEIALLRRKKESNKWKEERYVKKVSPTVLHKCLSSGCI